MENPSCSDTGHDKIAIGADAPKTVDDKSQKIEDGASTDTKLSISPDDKIGEIGMFWWTESLAEKDCQLLSRVVEHYTPEFVNRVLVPVVQQSFKVSLRALDWLCVNFAKEHNVVFYKGTKDAEVASSDNLVNLSFRYKDTLNEWRRLLFDPFRRRQRIMFTWKGQHHETTVAQLHFLWWADKNKALSLALMDIDQIEEEMNKSLKKSRDEKRQCKRLGKKRKRQQLTTSPTSRCVVYPIPTIVHFNEQ